MTQNLKIEVLTGDISIDGMVVTNLVTKEELSTAIVKKADLGTDGRVVRPILLVISLQALIMFTKEQLQEIAHLHQVTPVARLIVGSLLVA